MNSRKRKVDSSDDGVEIERTKAPKVLYDKSKENYYVRLCFYPTTGMCARDMCAKCYPSKEMADEEAPIFRFALENGLYKHWTNPSQRNFDTGQISNEIPDPYQRSTSSMDTSCWNGTPSRSLKKLTKPERDLFKAAKVQDVGLKIEEWKIERISSFCEDDADNFKSSLARNKEKADTKLIRSSIVDKSHYEQKMKYLSNTRDSLHHQMRSDEEKAKTLLDAIRVSKAHELILQLRLDDVPDEDQELYLDMDDYSSKQIA